MKPFHNKKSSVIISATALSLIIVALIVFFTIFGSVEAQQESAPKQTDTIIRSI